MCKLNRGHEVTLVNFLSIKMHIYESISNLSTEMNIYNKQNKELWHAFLIDECQFEIVKNYYLKIHSYVCTHTNKNFAFSGLSV